MIEVSYLKGWVREHVVGCLEHFYDGRALPGIGILMITFDGSYELGSAAIGDGRPLRESRLARDLNPNCNFVQIECEALCDEAEKSGYQWVDVGFRAGVIKRMSLLDPVEYRASGCVVTAFGMFVLDLLQAAVLDCLEGLAPGVRSTVICCRHPEEIEQDWGEYWTIGGRP